MRKPIILVVIAILLVSILAAVAGVFFYKRQANQKTSKEFVLTMETGTVLYKKSQNSEYTKMNTVEITLPTGSYVKTDKDSFAKVFFKDNSLVSIDQASEIQIEVQEKKIDINQFVGRTWNRVQSVKSGGEYQVKTPNAIAAVRGTVFGVDVINGNHSNIFVVQSNVDASRYEGNEKDVNILETQNVPEDKMAQIVKDEKSFRIEIGDIPDELKNSDWFKRNLIIDQEYFKISGLKGKELRNMLEKNLQSNSNYTVFRFGLFSPSDTTNNDIKSQLKKVEDITKINEQTCVNYSLSDIQLAMDRVLIYKEYINNYQDIENLLQLLKQSCSDGKIDNNETQLLQNEVNKINGK